MGGWCPVSRHYTVDGGHLVVTVKSFLTAKGTEIFLADDKGGPVSMEPIARYPEGTDHDQALTTFGYDVIDEIGPEPEPEPEPDPEPALPSVMDLLPPEIAALIQGGS